MQRLANPMEWTLLTQPKRRPPDATVPTETDKVGTVSFAPKDLPEALREVRPLDIYLALTDGVYTVQVWKP